MDPFRGRPTWAEVNLAQLRRNFLALKKRASPGAAMMAVVKANAYGHGAVEVARMFVEAGADQLAVAALGEALELRTAGIRCPILVLGWTPPEKAASALEYDIMLSLYSASEAAVLSQLAGSTGRTLRYHLKVDTGMGRIGLDAADESALDEAVGIASMPGLSLEGCFTHFADADGDDPSYTVEQLGRFHRFIQALEARGVTTKVKHAANSAALVRFPETHLDMVRPGIVMYGYYPSPHVDHVPGIGPALSFKTRIAHLKWVEEGAAISYNCTYHAPGQRRIASLPVGYADGFNRHHSNGGEVLVGGQRCHVVGRVCMDQTMVDVTGVEGVQVGDEVVLMGQQGSEVISADERAEELGTISHEVLCAIARRVPRFYVEAL